MSERRVLGGFDLAVLDDADFKEDAVREEIIHPILNKLGYRASGDARIVRSRSLAHPFVRIGTTDRPVTVVPDYLLEVDGVPAWILDAKAPNEIVATGDNVNQAYSYAIHPEVRCGLFALCNGREFALFSVRSETPLLRFAIADLEENWDAVAALVSPEAFRGASAVAIKLSTETGPVAHDYLGFTAPAEIRSFRKQAAKRYHGVHGYFTRQVWEVVQRYIITFSRPGDLVLDPFGGSGVTFIEALILGRRAIHVDINPLSKFSLKPSSPQRTSWKY
jgi:hypothetical protein